MLYFKKDLIAQAHQLVEAKGTQDDAKAVYYLTEISMIFQNYNATGVYDSQYAANLNQRIRGEYPLIDKLCRLPSNGTLQRDMNSSKGYPYELGLLDTDFYGILVTVLLKKALFIKWKMPWSDHNNFKTRTLLAPKKGLKFFTKRDIIL